MLVHTEPPAISLTSVLIATEVVIPCIQLSLQFGGINMPCNLTSLTYLRRSVGFQFVQPFNC